MDTRFAMLAALVANLLSNGKKQWKPEDFMPDFDRLSEDAPPAVSVVDKVKNYFGMLAGANKPAQSEKL